MQLRLLHNSSDFYCSTLALLEVTLKNEVTVQFLQFSGILLM